MSRYSLERFMYRFDKDKKLQEAFDNDPGQAFSDFELDETERKVLVNRDVATLYEWGIHSLLIRNFAGTCGVDYVTEYRKRKLQ